MGRCRELPAVRAHAGPKAPIRIVRGELRQALRAHARQHATFAATNVDVGWKKEAVEAAKSYLDLSPMSKDQLIRQLSSSAGEQFTQAEARYAASKVY